MCPWLAQYVAGSGCRPHLIVHRHLLSEVQILVVVVRLFTFCRATPYFRAVATCWLYNRPSSTPEITTIARIYCKFVKKKLTWISLHFALLEKKKAKHRKGPYIFQQVFKQLPRALPHLIPQELVPSSLHVPSSSIFQSCGHMLVL